jgi:hypothetical protein
MECVGFQCASDLKDKFNAFSFLDFTRIICHRKSIPAFTEKQFSKLHYLAAVFVRASIHQAEACA